ncbi:MAG TPA: ATP-binding protein [Anaerolineales bacterium]|nr:ATP-binding protein [Anaerolineales bacterium]
MRKPSVRTWRLNDVPLSLGVLVFLLAYTYGILFRAPYPGFYFNPSNGEILEIYSRGTTALKVGDFIERIGSISLDDFHENRNLNIFEGIGAGETIEIDAMRNGRSLTVSWVYPGFSWDEFSAHFFNIWWLAYAFWGIGMFTQLSMRPKDARWDLFVAMNYLMAMFIMLGSISAFQIMASATLLRVVAWMLLPVYLHFHWIFPTPLKPLPRWLPVFLYATGIVFAVGELLLPVPRTWYFFAVFLAFAGSLLLLISHFVFQRDHRREVSFLAFATLLTTILVILISLAGGSGNVPQSGPLAVFTLPILPLAYFYILYRRKLGGLELRTNRTISLYLFLILLGTILLLFLGYSDLIDIRRETIVFATVIIAVMVAGIGILLFPVFQTFVERRLLGVRLSSQRLAESYSVRIVASNTLADLTNLLSDEVFPSLFIRQYAVVRNSNPSAQVMLSREVTSDQVRQEALTEWLASSSAGELLPLFGNDPRSDWVHLALPLRIGSDLIGVWLLGRRDPDDHYPQAEIPVLQSLANQTAVALSNIIQTERLKAMYHANITRYEQERLRLAHDLHDSVLNEMAALLIKQEGLSQLPEFDEAYASLIQRVREIVSDLRPPMLAYGLKFALEGLADNLSERHHDKIRIVAEIREDETRRYPDIVENNLYRVVQEACENALKYSRANSINIAGELRKEEIHLEVVDDGIGFTTEINLPPDDMVINKHYGLAGMLERADLIGAEIKVESKPGEGTRVRVRWEAK